MDFKRWEVPVPIPAKRPPCKYGAKCYQKNKDHMEKYDHSAKKASVQHQRDSDSTTDDRNKNQSQRDEVLKVSVWCCIVVVGASRQQALVGVANEHGTKTKTSQSHHSVEKRKASPKHIEEGSSFGAVKRPPRITDFWASACQKNASAPQSYDVEKTTATDQLAASFDADAMKPEPAPPGHHDSKGGPATTAQPGAPAALSPKPARTSPFGWSASSVQRGRDESLAPISDHNEDDVAAFISDCSLATVSQLSYNPDFLATYSFAVEHGDLLSQAEIKLCGPFDLIRHHTGLLTQATPIRLVKRLRWLKSDSLLHCRYYIDVPEFQTILIVDGDSRHSRIGYFRDDPSEKPAFVGFASDEKPGKIFPVGDNAFAALHYLAKNKVYSSKLSESLCSKISASARSHGCPLEAKTVRMRQRDKKVVTRSFHGAGIVVPVENDVGYRELPESDADLRKIFARIVEAPNDALRKAALQPLQEIFSLVQFANDEMDYGEGHLTFAHVLNSDLIPERGENMSYFGEGFEVVRSMCVDYGLELGIAMFCNGAPIFHKAIAKFLPLAYQLLNRHVFADIARAHIASRSKELCDIIKF